MKKILLFTLLLSVLLLSGCASDSNSEGSGSGDAEPTENSQDSQDSQEKTEEKSWISEYDNPKLTFINEWTQNLQVGFEVTKESAEFINSYPNLFPSSNKEDINNLVDGTITYKHINKSPEKYTSKMIKFSGSIIDIQETPIEGLGTVAEIHVLDDNMQSYEILYLGELADIFKEDYISVAGISLGTNSFENVGGGYTNTIVVLGSYVEKIQ